MTKRTSFAGWRPPGCRRCRYPQITDFGGNYLTLRHYNRYSLVRTGRQSDRARIRYLIWSGSLRVINCLEVSKLPRLLSWLGALSALQSASERPLQRQIQPVILQLYRLSNTRRFSVFSPRGHRGPGAFCQELRRFCSIRVERRCYSRTASDLQVNRTGVKTTSLVAMVIEKVVVPFLIYCSA